MNTPGEMYDGIRELALDPQNNGLRDEVNNALGEFNSGATAEDRQQLNQMLENSGVLPHIALMEYERLDVDGDGGIETMEVARINGSGTDEYSPLTRLAARHVYDNFEEIDDMTMQFDSYPLTDDLPSFMLPTPSHLVIEPDDVEEWAYQSTIEAAIYDSGSDTGTDTDAAVDAADLGTDTDAAVDAADSGTDTDAAVDAADSGTDTDAAVDAADSGTDIDAAVDAADSGTDTDAAVDAAEPSVESADLDEALDDLMDEDVTVEERLNIIRELAERGITSITLTDADGNEFQARLEYVPVAEGSSRNYVHLFAVDETGRERIVLRATERDGEYSQQYDSNGNRVSFVGDWWTANRPGSAFVSGA